MVPELQTEHFGLSANQQEALDYWEAKKDARTMPRRKDIAFPDIVRVMPHTVIFDVIGDVENYRYRLVGTKVRNNTYEDYTGRLLTELEGKGPGSKVWDYLDTVRRDRAPLFREVPYVGPKKGLFQTTLLFLPLANDYENTDMIFVVSTFHRTV